MSKTVVADEEKLYRRIPLEYYDIQIDGTVTIRSNAFSSRDLRISVNRAALCGNDPTIMLTKETDGVVRLVAGKVRSINGLTRTSDEEISFSVDVTAAPLPDNPAHAEIYTIPMLTETGSDKKVFRKLREALTRIAESDGWEIEPPH